MSPLQIQLFFALCCLLTVAWTLPRKYQLDGIAGLSTIFITYFSLATALSLLISSALIYWITKNKAHKTYYILTGIVIISLQFLCIRHLQQHSSVNIQSLAFFGLSYYSCRSIHYLIEAYKGNINSNIKQLWYYQCFLPVFAAGPINRYNDFVRTTQRRRWNKNQLSQAIERITYGYLKVTFISNYIINYQLRAIIDNYNLHSFIDTWMQSLVDWAYLYAQFSGWSDIAIGFSLAMGFTIKENFNAPLKAKNLIDFWQRWHISLSS